MTWLLTADLHLTDRPRDEYRFGLFPWLAKQQQKYDVTATFLLGDITDRKDNHSSALVNRIIDYLTGLKPPIYILRGNHDGISKESPYFRFLSNIDGIDFVTDPRFDPALGVAFLPHQRDQLHFDNSCTMIPDRPAAIFAHNCFDGAIAETGSRLSGLKTSAIEAKHPKGMWAGDVHKPQTLNCGLTYVGAPFQVRFGDDFTPRVILLKNSTETDLHYPCLSKWSLTIRDPEEIAQDNRLQKGDQIKITVQLAREEAVEWATYRQNTISVCKELGLEVFGINLEVMTNTKLKEVTKVVATPQDVFQSFCQHEGIASNIKQAGLELLNV